MIDLSVRISNPFSSRWGILYASSKLLKRNKAIEFNLYKSNTIVNFEFRLNVRTDHAGLQTQFGLLGYELEFNFYDTRHWDDEKDTWYTYNH